MAEYLLVRTSRVLNRVQARRGAPLKLTAPRLTVQPVARLVTRGGPAYEGVRRAAAITVQRAKGSVNAYGRVDTRFMRDSIWANFSGSNQFAARAKIASRAEYSIWQHEGTEHISPAPFLTNALRRLRRADFL